MNPQRIQLQRTKGWRLPPSTKKVDRTTDFGNPYRIEPPARHGRWKVFGPGIDPLLGIVCSNRIGAQHVAVERFIAYCPDDSPLAEAMRRMLRGYNIGCWCKLGDPCHGNWVLQVANR